MVLVGVNVVAVLQVQSVDGEVAILGQQRTFLFCRHKGFFRVVGFVVDAVKGQFQVGLAAGGRVEFAAPVVEAVGDVRELLHFRNDNTTFCRVNGTSFDVEEVSGLGFYDVQHIQHTAFFAALVELVRVHVPVKAHVDLGSRFGVQHVPGFGLAVAIVAVKGCFVVRMDLQRKLFLYIQEFDQQGEFIAEEFV